MSERPITSPGSTSCREKDDVQLPPPNSHQNPTNLASIATAPRAEIPDSDAFSDCSSDHEQLQGADAEAEREQLVQGSAIVELSR